MNIGILGTSQGIGQLGQLLAEEAGKLDLQAITYGLNKPFWSAKHCSDLSNFYLEADLVTIETESFEDTYINEAKLIPNFSTLQIFRDRYLEKSFAKEQGFYVTDFYLISSEKDIQKIPHFNNQEYILKTCRFGYDGLGQKTVNSSVDLKPAWSSLGEVNCILEKKVQIKKELSIIVARNASGQIIHFPIPENFYQNHVLYRSRSFDIQNETFSLASSTEENLIKNINSSLQKLSYQGVITIELFQTEDGQILFNEAAPRVHNSGHYTLDFCENINQFSAHLKGILNKELLEPVSQFSYFSMTNLLGLNLNQFSVLKEELKNIINLFFYWYGKKEARPNRKMGHITYISNELTQLLEVEEKIDSIIKKLLD